MVGSLSTLTNLTSVRLCILHTWKTSNDKMFASVYISVVRDKRKDEKAIVTS